MTDIIKAIGGLLLIACIIFSCYWIAKTVIYSLFYESMVEQTVADMVKKEALK